MSEMIAGVSDDELLASAMRKILTQAFRLNRSLSATDITTSRRLTTTTYHQSQNYMR